jgi:hypothetical protein
MGFKILICTKIQHGLRTDVQFSTDAKIYQGIAPGGRSEEGSYVALLSGEKNKHSFSRGEFPVFFY